MLLLDLRASTTPRRHRNGLARNKLLLLSCLQYLLSPEILCYVSVTASSPNRHATESQQIQRGVPGYALGGARGYRLQRRKLQYSLDALYTCEVASALPIVGVAKPLFRSKGLGSRET